MCSQIFDKKVNFSKMKRQQWQRTKGNEGENQILFLEFFFLGFVGGVGIFPYLLTLGGFWL